MAQCSEGDLPTEVGNHDHHQDDDDEGVARMTAFAWATAPVVLFAIDAGIHLDLPRILGRSMLTVDEIANLAPTPTGKPVHAANLYRILRILAAHGLVKEKIDAEGVKRYAGSRALQYLSSEVNEHVDGTVGPMMLFFMDCRTHSILETILDDTQGSLKPSRERKTAFDIIGADPEFSRKFNKSMSSYSNLYLKLLLDQYDGFKSVRKLVDVGGGVGVCIAAIVAKYPHIRGINFDLPHVVASAPQFPGVEHVGGNFFESVPECDAVFMKCTLHDWNDDKCVTILKTIAKALPESGKIISVEVVLAEEYDLTKQDSTKKRIQSSFIMDLKMMCISPGAKERTLAQFCELGRRSGFSRVTLVTTIDYLSVLEFSKT